MRTKLNLTGKIINMLTVISQEPYSGGRSKFKVRCMCGNEKIVDGPKLNSGRIKSCGCYKQSDECRKSCGNKHRLEWGEALRRRVLYTYKNNAKIRDIQFDLTDIDLDKMFSQSCFYCGRKPYRTITKSKFYGSFTYNGIDRKDNDKGYTKTNCVSCCPQCNYLKNSYNFKEFMNIIEIIYRNHHQK